MYVLVADLVVVCSKVALDRLALVLRQIKYSCLIRCLVRFRQRSVGWYERVRGLIGGVVSMIYNKLMNQTRAESLRADQMRAESTKLMSLVTLHVLADRTSSSNLQRLVLHRLWVATMRGIRLRHNNNWLLLS